MKSFEYTIKDKLGIHARPAGMLAKAAKELDSEVMLTFSGKTVSAAKLMAVMGLGVKCGDTVTVSISGGDEENAHNVMLEYFSENL